MGPDTMVRASSLAFQLIVPPCVAITRRSNFAPCFRKRSLTFLSVWREGSAAYASSTVVFMRWLSLRCG